MSTPITSGAAGSLASGRRTASPIRSLSMNCSEPARGNTPRTRTRTKSESSPWSFTQLSICALLVIATLRESICRACQRWAKRPPAKHSRKRPALRVGLPNTAHNSSVPASVSAPSMVSQIGSGMAEASSNSAKARRPLLCRPAIASVLFSLQVMASTRQVRSCARTGRGERRRRVAEPVAVDRQPMPLGELRPGLGAQLAGGVGGDDAAGVRHRRHRPQDDPGDQRRLADAVARGDGQPQRRPCPSGCRAGPRPAGPARRAARPRARLLGQRAGAAPREGVEHEAQRIEAQRADSRRAGASGDRRRAQRWAWRSLSPAASSSASRSDGAAAPPPGSRHSARRARSQKMQADTSGG